MRKCLRCVISLVSISLLVGNAGVFAGNKNGVYVYTYLTDGSAFVITTQEKAVYWADYGVDAKFCPSASPFYCVNSEGFNFAVPKDLSKLKSWVVGNCDYKVVMPLSERALFGMKAKIAIIQGTCLHYSKDGAYYYYYSPKYGLLAFEARNPGDITPGPIILSQSIGFGAVQ